VDMGPIQTARIYAWPGTRGGSEFAVLRVWLDDLAVCGLLRPRVDVLSVDLPNWSQSWRQATPKLVRAVQAGSARYLGWLVPGDEIEFPTVDVIPGTGQIRSFLQDFPERHWVIKSFEQPTVVSLGPSYLAEEGLTSVAGLSDEATKVITRSWRPAVATLFSCRELVVVRRTALGQPRWHDGGSHLPLSWRPWQRAAEALG
jgi:CRISPR-associated endonuclease Csn1